MKKVVAILLLFVLVFSLGACSKNSDVYDFKLDNGKEVKIELNKKIKDKFSIYKDKDNPNSFLVINKNNQDEHVATGLFTPKDRIAYVYDKLDESDAKVIEHTDRLLYYSIENSEDKTRIEYNRFIQIDDKYVLYLGCFDENKELVDDFYKNVKFE